MKNFFYLSLLLLLCFCKSAKVKQDQNIPILTNSASTTSVATNNQKAKIKPQTITLIAESSSHDHVFAYYEDEFQDKHNLFFKKDSVSNKYTPITIKSKYAIWVRFADGGGGQYPVYLQPGDSLFVKKFSAGPIKYVFDGKRPDEHNFYTLMHQKGIGSLGFPDIMGLDIDNFKLQRRTKMYNYLLNERHNFLEKVKDSLTLSSGFYKFLRAELTTEYISGLLAPFYADSFNYQQLPERYIDTLASFAASGWFTQDSLVFNSAAYRRTIWHYNRFLSRRALKTPQELETLYQDAKTNFSGQTRNFALFYLLNENRKVNLNIAEYLAQFRNDCTYLPYIHYLDSIANRPGELISKEALLNTSLQTDTDATTNWKEILAKNKGKVIYIDLWATWCGPCLAEMPASRKLQE